MESANFVIIFMFLILIAMFFLPTYYLDYSLYNYLVYIDMINLGWLKQAYEDNLHFLLFNQELSQETGFILSYEGNDSDFSYEFCKPIIVNGIYMGCSMERIYVIKV